MNFYYYNQSVQNLFINFCNFFFFFTMSLAQLLCVTSAQKIKNKNKKQCADTNNKNQTKIVKSDAQQFSLSIWESQKMRKKKNGTHKRWALQLNQYSNEQNMKSRHEGASLQHNLGFQLFPFQFHLHHYHEHHLFLHSIQISSTLSLTVTVIYFFFCVSLYIFWYFHSLLLFLPQYHSKYTY